MQKMKRVGVAVDAINSYSRQVVVGVMNYAIQQRWLLIEEPYMKMTDPFAWPDCDGVIAMIYEPDVIHQFKHRFKHVVSASGAADPALLPVVSMDDHLVGQLAAQHLMACNLRHFAFYGVSGWLVSERRFAGFKDTLATRGFTCSQCPAPHDWDRPFRAGWKSRWPQVAQWLESLPKPVGIMAMEDTASHDLATVCQSAGILVPDHVAIIGVNNDELLCPAGWPPLSSVQTDSQRVGYAAARILDMLMSGTRPIDKADLIVRMPPIAVVQRASTDMLALDDPHVAAALRVIKQGACTPCSVSDVVREVRVDRRWLERQFMVRLGRTIYEEITRVRIDEAQRMLLLPDMTPKLVAARSGFSTMSSFTRAFQRTVKESPAAFRRARLEK